jgi:2Fe-2S ferredoxin
MEVSTKTLTIVKQNSDEQIFIQFTDQTNVLDLLNATKISIEQSCGGSGTCTTCRIFVMKNLEALSPRTDIEQERALERRFSDNERLACQCQIKGSAEIRIPDYRK